MSVALLNGMICGAILGSVAGIWLSDYRLGVVVGLAIVITILNPASIGAAVPLSPEEDEY